ncbi:ATP-dependent helicase HrpB [Edwardsiella anguillarum]|uniref:ATP-dependent helicase HrpB n=1 Tax=Edwardsiella anguillarum TaxID=1821960 RepID=UPI0024B67D47|nr:ATP-dependent helicase HrpB [Edwardsiella anguillarum]WHP80941.1 ATP-dependent helicase HrpB [Edwardsiella anguillarum]WHQ18443.1 ATP-dependent helicase HrpB [Edwardsiella anguillarum]WHQ21982.1 ATP-dependent helicase HrpB [Edwardsiella anguillarum]WHQ25506.1 ATP-dependent helicase HrpB [Edwardsiella anguillarum]WHQ29028.1 ATP-dependent helicase HrpB [Edwardsiella anguillarum]
MASAPFTPSRKRVESTVSLLPVAAVLPDLLAALQSASRVLLNAPTGAGKSTWLPLQLLQYPCLNGRIVMLEPRRLAARTVANRLAQQLGEPLGETVGYRMRGEHRVGKNTRLEVVTEGVLTRMLQRDPMLEGVALVILDEFHERSLQADLALALLLDVQAGLRDDLRLLIMSATLDDARLGTLLPDAPTIVSAGRSYPVARHYHPVSPHERIEQAAAAAVLSLMNRESGSLLLFLPGVGEIRRCAALLEECVAEDTDICPLYGALSLAEQQQAIAPAPAGRRKVVLATNIAETSLTIDGIRLVVDSALERVSQFDVRSGLTRLVTQRASQASMTQRAGRAGRLSEGICWHLVSAEQAERASDYAQAEILRSDLSALWLDLLSWGCRDAQQLTWLDAPPAAALGAAQRLLQQLDALDPQGGLSALGREMARTGSDPRLAAMLCAARDAGDAALACAALLAAIVEEPPRQGSADMRQALYHPQSHWRQRAAQLVKRVGGRRAEADLAQAPLWLAHAYPDRIAAARGQDGRYLLANGLGAALEADDALGRMAGLIAASLLQGASGGEPRILLALPCDLASLAAQLPHLVSEGTGVEWDEAKGTLRAWRRVQLGRLVLRAQPLARPDEATLAQALLEWVRTQGVAALGWDEAATQLRLRLICAQRWLPEHAWPAVDDESLLASLEQWLLPALYGVRDLRGLRQIDLAGALLRLLDWNTRQRLDSELPTHYTVPTGSRLAIRYFSDKPPTLAVRLQEMFGERESPRIAQGRVALVLELLSPAQRPLQITRDLAGFWQGAYREVQKEMKGRYPKHVWPDDPANAQPTRRTKRH